MSLFAVLVVILLVLLLLAVISQRFGPYGWTPTAVVALLLLALVALRVAGILF